MIHICRTGTSASCRIAVIKKRVAPYGALLGFGAISHSASASNRNVGDLLDLARVGDIASLEENLANGHR